MPPGSRSRDRDPAAGMRGHRPLRRRFPRLTLRVLVDYVVDGKVRCDYATTLGAGGLFVATATPLARGRETAVRFRLPGSRRLLEIPARVVWCQPPEPAGGRTPGMGLTFTEAAATADLARELERLARAGETGPPSSA